MLSSSEPTHPLTPTSSSSSKSKILSRLSDYLHGEILNDEQDDHSLIDKVYNVIELALYEERATTQILEELLRFLGSEEVQYLKDTSNRDLCHKLKTKAVVELELIIARLEQELEGLSAEYHNVNSYKELLEAENEQRGSEIEQLRREVTEEREGKRRAEERAREEEERANEAERLNGQMQLKIEEYQC